MAARSPLIPVDWDQGASFRCEVGGDVLSHRASPAVPSALRGLTSVFGMGTGVSLALQPPTHKVGSGCWGRAQTPFGRSACSSWWLPGHPSLHCA
jgi:hypothetical protein